jgi:hypothetical protein
MSFGQYDAFDPVNNPGGWDFDIIWLAIVAADMAGCVIVAATGNNNRSDLNHFPARHRLVIGVGGSDRNDDRKTPASPDGENWGANFGPGISVVAPSVQIPTTDRRGTSPNPASPSNALFGYNANGGGGYTTDGMFYPNCGDPAGDYF